MVYRSGSESKTVFPTCVGVNQIAVGAITAAKSLPHVRGGEPKDHDTEQQGTESSPRAWG